MTPKEVYEVLRKIGARNLHHANTVTTSCTFLEQGALLSRAYVEANGLKQTPQESDAIDKKYGIWDRVFLDHVDIHYRGGRTKGPNQYGPVLFVFDLDLLLRLLQTTEIGVTRSNPVHWKDKDKDETRWYVSPGELAQDITFGDFNKMLVINTSKIDFLDRKVRIELDNPQRTLSTGEDAYTYAELRLKSAAQTGQVTAEITRHICRSDCRCVSTYNSYGVAYFDSRFI